MNSFHESNATHLAANSDKQDSTRVLNEMIGWSIKTGRALGSCRRVISMTIAVMTISDDNN